MTFKIEELLNENLLKEKELERLNAMKIKKDLNDSSFYIEEDSSIIMNQEFLQKKVEDLEDELAEKDKQLQEVTNEKDALLVTLSKTFQN